MLIHGCTSKRDQAEHIIHTTNSILGLKSSIVTTKGSSSSSTISE